MIYEKIGLRCPFSRNEAELYVYILDNSPEIHPDRRRPMVIICPGGGYEKTSDREGEAIAMQFLAVGCHAALLRYSVAPATYPESLMQLAMAVNFIREKSELWYIDPNKIVVQGSSAGGHLAASLGVFWQRAFLSEQLGVPSEKLRPNGLILSYPVITSGAFAHEGSFVNLTGHERGEERGTKWENLSLEKQVSAHTPPTFLWHTASDDTVPVENSLLFFEALHRYHIPVEMHIYGHGGHGLGLANEETSRADGYGVEIECQTWIGLAQQWVLRL